MIFLVSNEGVAVVVAPVVAIGFYALVVGFQLLPRKFHK